MHSHTQDFQRQIQPFTVDRQLEELLHQARIRHIPGAQHQPCQLNLWHNTDIFWALLSSLLDKACCSPGMFHHTVFGLSVATSQLPADRMQQPM